MKKELVAFHEIPIYPTMMEFCVTEDIIKTQKDKKRIKKYGGGPVKEYHGLVWYAGNNIAIIIRKDSLTHEVIGHEIFHATHRIIQSCGVKYDFDNDEAFAYLCGYLTNFVYGKIKQWKLKVQ